MRSIITTSPRTLFFNAALLTLVACDDHSVEPLDGQRGVLDHGDMAGTYEGTVQGPGGTAIQVGEAALTVDQTGDSISGNMIVAAEFTEGNDTISLVFESTYTGVVRSESYPGVVLLLENPVCGGTTEFSGLYAAEHSALTLAGEYALQEEDGCETVTTLDLTVFVREDARMRMVAWRRFRGRVTERPPAAASFAGGRR